MTATRTRTVLAVAAAVLLGVALRLPFLTDPLEPDEAGYLLVARQWHLLDAHLYGHLWVDRPPLLVLLFRLADTWGPYGVRLLGVAAVAVLGTAAGSAGAVGSVSEGCVPSSLARITWNVASADHPLDARAETRRPPARAPSGTVSSVQKVPNSSANASPNARSLTQEMLIDSATGNPLPVTSKVEPGVPCVGVSAICGSMTGGGGREPMSAAANSPTTPRETIPPATRTFRVRCDPPPWETAGVPHG